MMENLKKVCFGCLVVACAVRLSASDISLDGIWKLSYRHQQEGGEWTILEAPVPGDTNEALVKAGVLPDPKVGTNVFVHLPAEQYEWKYERTFSGVLPEQGGRQILQFDGVDTRAEYFLNGERLGASDNMFIPVSFNVTGKLKSENKLVVHIRSILGSGELGVLGRNRIGGTDGEYVRKAQHSFGWDIMPRLVSSGIWKSVTLRNLPAVCFDGFNFFVRQVDAKARTAQYLVDYQITAPWRYLHRAKLRFTLSRNGKVADRFENVIHFYQTRANYRSVRNADLWWPRDAGESALYEAKAEFVDEDGRVLATDVRKVGLRTIRLERENYLGDDHPGTFRFIVNGEPIYMHGCDITPMDAQHAHDREHVRKCCEMLVDLNCNMVRSWGGGVYEDDAFFDFCDAHGILVWQDFSMGNIQPVQRDDFAKAIEAEATAVVKRLRWRPSLALWCGNNEIDRSMAGSWGEWAPNPDEERISREVLPRVLREFDPFTPYLASSPLWDAEAAALAAKIPSANRGSERRILSQDHLWGPRARYFKGPFWTNSVCTFVSETGVHGCPNYASLKRMMTSEGLYPWPDKANKFKFNAEWRCKAVSSYPDQTGFADGRNALMSHQVKTFFGSVPDDLETYVDQSQIYQAEALKCWVAAFRCRKGRTWGMLWWNLRDGWPILSDGVVDYYFGKKRAYETLKSIQQPQLVHLCDGYLRGIYAVNDRLYPVKGRVKVMDAESKKILFEGMVSIGANATVRVMDDPALAGQGALVIEYTFENAPRRNVCLYGEPPFDYKKVSEWLK